jgi:ACR3 family arsenite transporter
VNLQLIREALESRQIAIYFGAVAAAVVAAHVVSGTAALEGVVNPALALMLYLTFLQVPMSELKLAFGQVRFLGALLVANFLVVPLLVWGLIQFCPDDLLLRLGVLLVLLTPCIDYVVTFSHLGRADARLLLAATPVLLVAQMLLLPGYLAVFLGEDAARLVDMSPFVLAFAWLIVAPLVLAALTQFWAVRSPAASRAATALGLLPVPATALVLFVVVAAVLPQLEPVADAAWHVVPVYIAFAVISPALGWLVARWFRLEVKAGRSVAFSTGTRNSLVVLPLAMAVPGALPVLPAVIVTQTLVELLSELVYMPLIAMLGRATVVS